MQAIETRYIGPSNTKPSRIMARCEAKRIVTSRHHEMNIDDNHRAAAMELIEAIGWYGHWVQASVPSNKGGYVFVCYQRHDYEGEIGGPRKRAVEGFDVYPNMAKAA